MQAASKLVDESIKKGASGQASAGQVAGALGLAYLEADQDKEALQSLQQAEKILETCRGEADSQAMQALDEARVCTGEFPALPWTCLPAVPFCADLYTNSGVQLLSFVLLLHAWMVCPQQRESASIEATQSIL